MNTVPNIPGTWTPTAKVTRSRSLSSEKYVVEVEVSESGIRRQAGAVWKATDGSWMATAGYFNRSNLRSLGPFRLRREAVESLIGPAVAAYERQAAAR